MKSPTFDITHPLTLLLFVDVLVTQNKANVGQQPSAQQTQHKPIWAKQSANTASSYLAVEELTSRASTQHVIMTAANLSVAMKIKVLGVRV